MIHSVEQLAESGGVGKACQALAIPRSRLHRTRQLTDPEVSHEPTVSPRALQTAEKAEVRRMLNSERFADQPPREVYASLLDEGKYLALWELP